MDIMYNRQDNIRQFLLSDLYKKALDKYLFKKTALTKFRKDRQETF